MLLSLSQKSWADENPAAIQTVNPYFNNQKLSQASLLVLQVNLGNLLILDDPIIGYAVDDKIFLSFKDFVRVLELPIKIADDNMMAGGWFIEKSKNFSLDLNKNRCQANHKKFITSPDEIILLDNDIFVSTKTLQQWFGLEMNLSLKDQEIGIKSGGLLPVELRFERQKQWQKLTDAKQNNPTKPKEDLESIKTPYKLVSVPFGNLNYRQNYNKSEGSSSFSSQLNGLFNGDFLYLNNQIFATAQDGKMTNVRITSGRRDVNGKLLGALEATEFSIGDINMAEQPLISRVSPGRGATISNYPLEYVNQFNKVSIRGNAEVGWDVEIYRNDSLLNFQRINSDGIYEFLDVPLLSGLNIIKLVFYGPFGQQYQENKRFMVGNDLLQEGKIYYRFAANQNNQNLIQIQEQNIDANNNQGVGRFFGELGYGLTKTTSVVTNFVRIPDNFSDKQNDYTSLSLRSSLLGISGRFDVVKDLSNQSYAQQASTQTKLFNYNLSAIFDNFNKNFISENNPQAADPLLNRTLIRLDGPLKIPFINFPSRVSLTGIRENFFSRKFRDNLQSDLSLRISNKLSLTQTVEYISDSRIEDERQQVVNGQTLFNYLFSQKLTARSGISYNLQPHENLNNLNLSLSYNLDNNFNITANADHHFSRENQPASTNYSASLSKTFRKVIISLGTNYVNHNHYGISLNLSSSFGYSIKNNTGLISGLAIANGGAVDAKVFIDENNNGIFDKGEETLKDIEILVNDGIKKAKTDKSGTAFITNLQLDKGSKISINPDSLPDPYLLVKKKAIKVFGHSGSVSDVDLPVLRVGEISGYVILNQNDSNNPAANIELQLINEKGNVIATTKSGYDGFYLFEMVPFDKYQIQISAISAIDKLSGLNFVEQKYDLELNKEHQVIEKMNLNIKSVEAVEEKNS